MANVLDHALTRTTRSIACASRRASERRSRISATLPGARDWRLRWRSAPRPDCAPGTDVRCCQHTGYFGHTGGSGGHRPPLSACLPPPDEAAGRLILHARRRGVRRARPCSLEPRPLPPSTPPIGGERRLPHLVHAASCLATCLHAAWCLAACLHAASCLATCLHAAACLAYSSMRPLSWVAARAAGAAGARRVHRSLRRFHDQPPR